MSNELKLVAIRGATCAENTKESISNATVEMCNKLFSENNCQKGTCNLIYVNFIVKATLWAFKSYLHVLEVVSTSQHRYSIIKIPPWN